MVEQTYLVTLMDGVKFKTSFVDIALLKKKMDDHRIHAIKLGNKGVVKHNIAFIADASFVTAENASVQLMVANEPLNIVSDNIDSAIVEIIDNINANQWVVVENGLMFNKNAFQHIEEYSPEV